MTEIISHIRYELDPAQIGAFEEYARVWTGLIEANGGTHFGFFLPPEQRIASDASFPGLGVDAPENIAVALFSFPDEESYSRYRRDVATHPECVRMTALVEETSCFTRYERSFFRRVAPARGETP